MPSIRLPVIIEACKKKSGRKWRKHTLHICRSWLGYRNTFDLLGENGTQFVEGAANYNVKLHKQDFFMFSQTRGCICMSPNCVYLCINGRDIHNVSRMCVSYVNCEWNVSERHLAEGCQILKSHAQWLCGFYFVSHWALLLFPLE